MNITRGPWRFTWILGLALLAVSAAGAGWVLHAPAGDGPARGRADGSAASPSDDTQVVCFGLVDVEHGVTNLFPLQPGRVTDVLVHEGQEVEAGKPLLSLDVTIDREQARLQVQEAEQDLESAKVQLEVAEKGPRQHQAKVEQAQGALEATRAKLVGARAQLNWVRDAVKRETAKEVDLKQAEAQVKALEASERVDQSALDALKAIDPSLAVRLARVNVEAKKIKVERAKEALKEQPLLAPEDGTVLRIQTRKGDVFGAPGRPPAFVFCPKAPRLVRAEVEQEFAGRVALDQAAVVQDDMRDDLRWTGRVARIADSYLPRRTLTQEPFQPNDVRTLEILVTLDPGQPQPRLNQRVRVTLGKTPR
jgi:multidrug resistance efflux pump